MWPREGKPVAFYWPVYIHAARLIIPLALLALLLRKPNRARGAWWVLLPPLVLPVAALWVLEQLWNMDLGGVTGFLGDGITLPLFALAFLWLSSYQLINLPRPKAFSGALGTLGLAGIIGLLGVSSFGYDATLILKAFLYVLFVAVFLAALSLAAFESRKRYTPLRFLFRFFIILVVGIALVATALSMFMVLSLGFLMGNSLGVFGWVEIIVGQMTVSAFAGGVLFLLLLPFLALALWCPIFRQRFHAILRLPGMRLEGDNDYNDLSPEVPVMEDSPPAGEPPETKDEL